MSNQLSLFDVNNTVQDKFKWQIYVSSALTAQDGQTMDTVKRLNTLIKGWLQDSTESFVYLPQEYSDPSRADSMKPEEIYMLDRWRIAESDFIVMNLDQPSFGVGQESEIANSMGIPIIAFHYYSKKISRMIRGIPTIYPSEGNTNPSDGVFAYSDPDYKDLKDELMARVRRIQTLLKPLSTHVASSQSFSTRLQQAIQKNRKTVEEVAKEAGFTEAFVRSLLDNYKSVETVLKPYNILNKRHLKQIPEERYLNPGLWVIRKLAKVLKIKISSLIEEDFNKVWHEPIQTLGTKGVTLNEFVNVISKHDTGFLLLYEEAAKTINDDSFANEVSDNLYNLVLSERSNKQKE